LELFTFRSRSCADWLHFLIFDVILVIRVHAIYGQRKKVLLGLAALASSELISMGFVCLVSGPSWIRIYIRPDIIPGPYCTVAGPHWASAMWFIPLTFQLILLGMVLFKGFKSKPSRDLGHLRQNGSQPRRDRWEVCRDLWEFCRDHWQGPRTATIFNVLLQDQSLYFIVYFLVNLTNGFVWITHRGNRRISFEVGLGFTLAIPCVLISRMSHNLKEVGKPGMYIGAHGRVETSNIMELDSHIVFDNGIRSES